MSKSDIRHKIEEIKKSFKEKNFDDVIYQIEKLSNIKNRSPELSSLSGICKIIKPNSKKNEIFSALNDFEDAYIKAKKNNIGLESVCNYISTCILHADNYPELLDSLSKVKSMFTEAKQSFGFNEKLNLAGIKLNKFTLDYKNMRINISEMIKNKTKHLTTACRWAHINNYSYNWKQEDYLNYSNDLKKSFPNYNTKNLSEIDFKENSKIKVGFISCNFNLGHSITYFIRDIVSNLDKLIFETYAIDVGKYGSNNNPDAEFKNNYDHWLELNNKSNQEVIDIIQENKIEILIDTISLTYPDRTGILNNRICPLQISWLAYCNTLGFDTIDYLVADKYVIKNGEEKYYKEEIIKLPNIWSAHAGFNLERKYQNPPILENKHITFGSFNNFLKISDEVVETWSKILKKVDGSKLILKSSESYNYEIIKKKFAKYNVENSIIILDKKNFTKIEDHLNQYDKVDIALDTFPYTGVTTTFEALWKSVPVITMAGHNFKSRCGESIIRYANISELICLDRNDYVNKAVELSKDINAIKDLRKKIFNNILKTPLFKTKEYTIEFQDMLTKKYSRNNL